jgi:FixJ family two-component response regulator
LASAKNEGDGDIFVLDDDANVRETLSVILKRSGYNPICFANEVALLQAMRRSHPVCVFLDIMLPGRSGLEILKDMAEYSAPVVIISGHGNIPIVVDAMKGGAVDFIEKPFTGEQIVSRVKKFVKEYSPSYGETPKARLSSLNFPGRASLSLRELEVMEQIALGLSSKEAGLVLGISSRTVEDHQSNIMRKLGLRNRAELIIAVLKNRE